MSQRIYLSLLLCGLVLSCEGVLGPKKSQKHAPEPPPPPSLAPDTRPPADPVPGSSPGVTAEQKSQVCQAIIDNPALLQGTEGPRIITVEIREKSGSIFKTQCEVN